MLCASWMYFLLFAKKTNKRQTAARAACTVCRTYRVVATGHGGEACRVHARSRSLRGKASLHVRSGFFFEETYSTAFGQYFTYFSAELLGVGME